MFEPFLAMLGVFFLFKATHDYMLHQLFKQYEDPQDSVSTSKSS